MTESRIFHIRQKADHDLDNIFMYSYENWGTERAFKYIDDLVQSFQLLADNYKLGRSYNNVRADLYGYKVVSHIIFYKPTDHGIDIHRTLHKSMDYKRHI